MRPDTDNEVIDLSPPKEWLYKCDCPQCRVGLHYNKDIADSYRKRGELNNEVARLRKLMRDYIDFIDENMGTTADWPMEAAFDDETTAQRHCDLLNAMKREVKPEDIN